MKCKKRFLVLMEVNAEDNQKALKAVAHGGKVITLMGGDEWNLRELRRARRESLMEQALFKCVDVFASMGRRGRYPEELLPDSKHFLGHQGFQFIYDALDGKELSK